MPARPQRRPPMSGDSGDSGIRGDGRRGGVVAIIGKPNTGKSTLINQIAKKKISAISRRRQTTRAVGQAATDDARILWLDAPGWQERYAGALHKALNRNAEHAIWRAQVILYMTVGTALTDADLAILKRLPADAPVIGVINKIDLIKDKTILLPVIQRLAEARDFTAIIPVSAKTGEGLDALKDAAVAHLPTQTKATAEADDLNFTFAELLREKIFHRLDKELPYRVGVITDKIEDAGKHLTAALSVYVEKESQRRILLGKNGAMMKDLATRARQDMEKTARRKIYLTVQVKVADWTNKPPLLKKMRIL